MIKIKRNCKEIEEKKIGAKSEQNRSQTERKQGKNRGLRNFAASVKSALCCKTSLQPQAPLCETNFGTRVPLCSTRAYVSQLRNALRRGKAWFRNKSPIPQGISRLRGRFWHTSAISQHSDPHFAAAKWLRNLYTLKSFSAHTMNRHVIATPPFWQLLDTIRSLSEVQIIHVISRFKAWEVRSP